VVDDEPPIRKLLRMGLSMLEQDGVEVKHRQARRQFELDVVARQHLARTPQRAADDLAEVVAGGVGYDGARLELRHVEQVGNETVQPLRLVDDGGEQIGLLGIAERS
jgi:hypothetical protein